MVNSPQPVISVARVVSETDAGVRPYFAEDTAVYSHTPPADAPCPMKERAWAIGGKSASRSTHPGCVTGEAVVYVNYAMKQSNAFLRTTTTTVALMHSLQRQAR
jgi:hypothetical protein